MSGSGGTAGSVKYAQYLEDYHQAYLNTSGQLNGAHLGGAVSAAWGSDPYLNTVYSNPGNDISNMEQTWVDVDTLYLNLNEETDWADKLTKAVAEIDALGVLKEIDVNALATSARAGAGNVATDIDGLISLTDIDPDAISVSSRTEADLVKNAVVGSYLDWGAAIDAVVAKLTTASPDINISSIISSHFSEITLADLFTLVEGRISNLLSTIITEAFATINPALLQDLADTFIDQRANDRARTRTRYKANAAVRGASHSSAYALGLALLDSDFSKEVTSFQVQANLQLYQQGIETYNNLVGQYLGNAAQVEISNRTEKTRFAGQAAILNKQLKDQFLTTNTLQKLTHDVQKKQIDAGTYVEAFRAELTNRLQAKLSDKSNELQAALAKVTGYVEAFRNELTVRGSAKSQEKQTRDGMVDNAINAMLAHHQFKLAARSELAALNAEIKRIGFVMSSEYTGNTLDRALGQATYKLRVLGLGVPVLGALGGGTALPDKPSKAGSALGGALSGAVTGGMAAGKFGPKAGAAGAAGGLVLGGLAGLLGG